MTAQEREIFYLELIAIVRKLQRNYSRVYPWMLIPHLPVYRCEQTLRKDMAALAQSGYLIRPGGPGSRRGYHAPSLRRAA